MTNAVPDVLARIVSHKDAELKKATISHADLEKAAEAKVRDRRDFKSALQTGIPAIIAEVKKASPSKGLLAPSFDPVGTALQYQAGGASALSVLTDSEFFQGSLHDLQSARAAVHIPVLRKDFTINEYHVVEAAANGADAILLIAAILDVEKLRRFRQLANQYRMAALVEVHDDAELDAALASGADIIGVNNRDLRTFEVTLDTSLHLAARMPADVVKVAESGIHNREQVKCLTAVGFNAFLIGEHLMRSDDPSAALRALLS